MDYEKCCIQHFSWYINLELCALIQMVVVSLAQWLPKNKQGRKRETEIRLNLFISFISQFLAPLLLLTIKLYIFSTVIESQLHWNTKAGTTVDCWWKKATLIYWNSWLWNPSCADLFRFLGFAITPNDIRPLVKWEAADNLTPSRKVQASC